jgi:hypothetical protein
MTLLAPLALLLGVSALVPLILHLYQRRNRTVIQFSTNRFFTQALVRAQRRLQLQRLLLLLLRMGACLLLALALSQPIWQRGLGAGAAGQRDLVIVLDDSLSMQATDPTVAGAPPRFDRARALAVSAVQGLASGDRAAVITFTGRQIGNTTRAGVEPTEDRQRVVDELTRLQPTAAAGDAATALTTVARVLGPAERRSPLVLVLSDFQEGDWPRGGWPQPTHAVPIGVVSVGPPPTANIVVERAAVQPTAVLAGQPSVLGVQLANHGPQAVDTELVVRVDEQERLRRPVRLPGRGAELERVPLTFDRPGLYRLSIAAGGRDALPADNQLVATILVHAAVPILLVDGDAGGDTAAGRSAAYYVRAALRAVSTDAAGLPLLTIRPEDFAQADLSRYRVVVLSNVPRLSVDDLARLEAHVQSGAGLLVLLGDRVDPTFYNTLMASPSRSLGGLMPGELHSQLGGGTGALPLHILAADLQHPVLAEFAGSLRGGLADVTLYKAHVVKPRNAWVLATLDQEAPFILERAYGQGRVLVFTAPPQPTWTDLPLRGAFLPLLTRTMSYLAGAAGALPVTDVGQELELLRGGWNPDTPLYVLKPDGTRALAETRAVGGAPQELLPAATVDEPGFYQLDVPQGTDLDAAHRVRAVNTARRESDPGALDLAAAQTSAGAWRLTTLTPDAATDTSAVWLDPLLSAGGGGRAIWNTLLWTVLVLLLVEPLIANRRARQRDAAPADARRAA